MAAKRFFDDSDHDNPDDNNKRIRTTPRPSFASIIGEVVMLKNMQNLFSSLEPLLRRVVSEEMDRAMRHCSTSTSTSIPRSMSTPSPSLRIEASMEQQRLQLMFSKDLCLPIFTGSKIVDADGNPIRVLLMEKNGDHMVRTSLPHPLKLELVVLDGDFPDTWTSSDEFNRHLVKERTGRRPLLAGELNLTMRDGVAPTGDIEFTDNSSWIRSRKFRIAVRAVEPTGTITSVAQNLWIRQGVTQAFVVKDHRGELYKKHHPPMLQDEVWRLEKIGKDGAFHKKLSLQGIHTVQDFLKLSVVDPPKLRKILGMGMSEKMWEVLIKHARTCEMGNKLYIYRGPHFAIYLNPICQMIKAEINGQVFSGKEITSNMNKSYIQKLVGKAYSRWGCLEEIDAFLNDNIGLLTQGHENVDQFGNNNNHQATSVITYDESDLFGGGSNNAQMVGTSNNNEWTLNNPTFSLLTPSPTTFIVNNNGISYSFSDSQSDGDITPSASAGMDGAATALRWP